MDSGLLASLGPGMTDAVHKGAEHARTERRPVRYGYIPAVARCVIPNTIGLQKSEENPMVITATQIGPLVAIAAGILILIMPRLLNYVVAIYLIIIGLEGLHVIHRFI
jgi:hypothetical protein